jgi:hypothetical protein
MNKALPIALAVLLAVFAVIFAYTIQGPTEGSEAVELRVYKVPGEYHNDIESSLRYALSGMSGDNSKLVGRVAAGPNGTLVVTAPPRIHKGVEAFLRDLEDVEAPPAQLLPISLMYSFIVGRPVEPSAISSQPYIVTGKRMLTELRPALEQIAAVQGPTEFSLLEQIQLTAVGHERAEARGKMAMVEQRATRTAQDTVAGEVLLSFDGRHQLRSQIALERGQFLVLGQSGFGSRKLEPFGRDEDTSDATLYYVMTSNLEQ